MTVKQTAIAAALGAGKILRDGVGSVEHDDIEKKNPFDYVTKIDTKSEQHIINLISAQFPDHEILAEESGASPQKNGNRWIIDPLDGTTNFIHSYPQVAVSIAFEVNAEIMMGVVYDPFRDELFVAEKGNGAYCNGKKISVSHRSDLSQCLIATGFPFKNRDLLSLYWQVLSEIFMHVSGIRRTGSAALDLAHIACGRFDGFWELKLSPWDVAAGSLLISESGGKITDFENQSNHIWSGDVIATNSLIHNFILSSVQKVFSCNP
ncbi:MAG TPA: inositol monophosphatase [bacterium]|nr:inositol monophosphatase [bacterium]